MSLLLKACSVCSAPPDVQTAIHSALDAREPLRKLARRSGFSRASLSRHNRKCRLRARIAQHRAALSSSDAFWVQWPGKPIPETLPTEVGWIAVVEYEPPLVDKHHALALIENQKRDLAATQASTSDGNTAA